MPMISLQLHEFGRPLQQVMRDVPRPEGREVVLAVDACGVCHSDVHLHDGHFSLAGDARLDLASSVRPPRTLGHEIAGRVVAVGPDADGVAIGEQRVVYPWIGCGRCAVCAAGDEHLCPAPAALGVTRDGGFATHVVVPEPRYLLDFAPLSPEQAAPYACSGLTAYAALRKLGEPGAPGCVGAAEPLLIVGAGGVGLSGVRLARHLRPAARIVVADADPARADLAREAGADGFVDPRADGAGRALVKATGGGVGAAIDFVGAGATFEFALAALRKGGRLVAVGLMGGGARVVPSMLALKAVSVAGSYVGTLAEMREVLAIARTGRLPALPLVERPLAEATDALDDLRDGRVRGRAVLRP